MQLEKFKIISKNIDDLINRALNFNYNQNFGIVDFSREEMLLFKNDKIELDIFHLKVNIHSVSPSNKVLRINKRIPQSRIYITYLQNSSFYLRIIKFYDQIIILGESYDSAESQDIFLSSNIFEVSVQNPETIKIAKDPVKISLDNGFIAQAGNEKLIEPAFLPEQIINWINKERKNHPLHYIRDDGNVLLMIDNLWSELEYIKSDNFIDIKILNNSLNNFIWLQELYIHFGFYDKLNSFYKVLENSIEKFEHSNMMIGAYLRYKQVCGLMDRPVFELKKISNLKNVEIPSQYLNYFFFKSESAESLKYNKIQETWNYLYLPAVQLKVKSLIENNPDEYIAYACLVLQYRFWWFDKLESMLIKYLPENMKILVELLLLVKQIDTIRFQSKSVYISKYLKTNKFHEFKSLLGSINKKETSHNRNNFTLLEIPNSFFLKINKEAEIEYFPALKEIKIYPRLYSFQNEWDHNCIIEISGFKLFIPLIWDQMTIEFNKCRFKFLRKKRRFQVTIKIFKEVKYIRMNGSQIDYNSEPVTKYYIPITKKTGNIHLTIFNEFGYNMMKPVCGFSRIFFSGYGINCYGILQTKFRLYFYEQKKSYNVELNNSEYAPINVATETSLLEIRGTKFDSVKIPVNKINPFVEKLAYSDIPVLFNRLKFKVDINEDIIPIIRKTCFENIGIIPKIDFINDIEDKYFFNLIISNESFDESSQTREYVEVQPINKKCGQYAIIIDPDRVESLFTEDFWAVLFG